jgi:hypothetical protein
LRAFFSSVYIYFCQLAPRLWVILENKNLQLILKSGMHAARHIMLYNFYVYITILKYYKCFLCTEYSMYINNVLVYIYCSFMLYWYWLIWTWNKIHLYHFYL